MDKIVSKLQIDSAVAKQVAEMICEEITDSRRKNASIYTRARRCENQYNQVTKWTELNRVCDNPWYGAADYFIPLTEWIIDAVWARVVNVIYAEEPIMSAVATSANSVDRTESVTMFADLIMREIVKLRKNSNYFFKQMIKLPFAVLKYRWVREVENLILKEKHKVFISPTGEKEYVLDGEDNDKIEMLEMQGYKPLPAEEVYVRSEKELYDAPKLQYIQFEDYVWSPGAKRDVRLYWEGDRFWNTLAEITQYVENDIYISGSSEKVSQSLKLEEKEGANKAIAMRSNLIECYDWYGRLPFNRQNEVDLENTDVIEQEVHLVVAYKEKELLQADYWEYSRIPNPERVYIRGMYEETENFVGRSLSEKLYMTQQELNTLHNTIMNNAMIAMQKIFVKQKGGTEGDEDDKVWVYPGAVWTESIPNSTRVLDVGDIKTVGLELEMSLINYAERISNITIYNTGTERREGQKTKGEVVATIEEGNIGRTNLIQNCIEILRKIYQWTIDFYEGNMPVGLERQILGENGETIFPTDQTQEIYETKGISPYWRTEDISGKWEWKWNGTVLSGNKKLQIAVTESLQDRYLPHPMIAGNLLATWEILKRGLLAKGILDWQKMLPPREAIIAEMQKQKVESGAMDKRRAAEVAMPGKVINQLVQRGMPRNIAMQTVQKQLSQKEGPLNVGKNSR